MMKAIRQMGIAGLAVAWMVGSHAAEPLEPLDQNAVGYVKVSMEEGKTYLITHPFLDVEGGPTVLAEVIGDQVPVGADALFWSGTGFLPAVHKDAQPPFFSDPRWDADTEFSRGEGFFIRIPPSSPYSTNDVFLLGEVPGASNMSETTTVLVAQGWSLLGYPYPAQIAWTGTVLAASATVGDLFLTWDPDSGYVTSEFEYDFPAPRWNPSDKVLPPGEGFLYFKSSPGLFFWEEIKPYPWP